MSQWKNLSLSVTHTHKHTNAQKKENTVVSLMAAWQYMNITSYTQSSFLFIHLSAKRLFLIAASKPSAFWKHNVE